jgi:hypothetical protein
MNASRSRRTLVALTCAALAALTLSVADTAAADNRVAATAVAIPSSRCTAVPYAA